MEEWSAAEKALFGSIMPLRTVGCFFTRNSGTVPMCGLGVVVFGTAFRGPMESFFFLFEEFFVPEPVTLTLISGLIIRWL